MRGTPAALCLQDVPPQRHLAEDPADRARLVASACVRQRVDDVTRSVKAAIAHGAGNRMRSDRQREGILVEPAFGDDRMSERPHEIVEYRAESEPAARLDDRPRAPAPDRHAELADCVSSLHQRALPSRVSAGWMTSSTRP